jgi:hypothetical protein
VRAASCGLCALGFYPKRYDEKPPQKLAVWIQLQRSRPEAETNSHWDFSATVLFCAAVQGRQRLRALLHPTPMAGYRGGSSVSASTGGGGSAVAAAFSTRLLLLLTLLPLALAAFAFALQWRGGMRDPAGAAWPADAQRFPGMENSPLSSSHGGAGSYFAVSSSSSSPGADCAEILGRSAASSNGISLYRGWSFDSESAITPKVSAI